MKPYRPMACGPSVQLNEFFAKVFEFPKIIHIFARFYTEGALVLCKWLR